MAASTVGMLSPATQFSHINIHRVRLGVFNGVPYAGSLEFLAGQARLVGWPDLAQRVEDDEAAPLPEAMDLVIMNPPYTRDSLRYDQFNVAEELAVTRGGKRICSVLPLPICPATGPCILLTIVTLGWDQPRVALLSNLALSCYCQPTLFSGVHFLNSRNNYT